MPGRVLTRSRQLTAMDTSVALAVTSKFFRGGPCMRSRCSPKVRDMDRDSARARRIELLEQGPLDAAVREEVARLNAELRECVTCRRKTDGRGRCASCAARVTFAAAATTAGDTAKLLEKAADMAAEEARGQE